MTGGLTTVLHLSACLVVLSISFSGAPDVSTDVGGAGNAASFLQNCGFFDNLRRLAERLMPSRGETSFGGSEVGIDVGRIVKATCEWGSSRVELAIEFGLLVSNTAKAFCAGISPWIGAAGIVRETEHVRQVVMILLPCIFEAAVTKRRQPQSSSSGRRKWDVPLTRTRAFRPGMQIELQLLQKERFNAGSLARFEGSAR